MIKYKFAFAGLVKYSDLTTPCFYVLENKVFLKTSEFTIDLSLGASLFDVAHETLAKTLVQPVTLELREAEPLTLRDVPPRGIFEHRGKFYQKGEIQPDHTVKIYPTAAAESVICAFVCPETLIDGGYYFECVEDYRIGRRKPPEYTSDANMRKKGTILRRQRDGRWGMVCEIHNRSNALELVCLSPEPGAIEFSGYLANYRKTKCEATVRCITRNS